MQYHSEYFGLYYIQQEQIDGLVQDCSISSVLAVEI